MSKILITAYAVNPYKGSEDGMGWNMICQIARKHQVIAITRENNEPEIRRYLQENEVPEASNIEWAFFDWPYWMRFWKRKERGALLYFYLWQLTMPRFIKSRGFEFDVCHNLNFHNDWTPSFLWQLAKPMIWGPIGHHPLIPDDYLKVYSDKARWKNRITYWLKQAFWQFDPFLYTCRQKAFRIIAMNSTIAQRWPDLADKIRVIPSVGTEAAPDFFVDQSEQNKEFTIISVGRFVALKGFDITIRAFSRFYHQLPQKDQNSVRLKLIGKGPEEALMRAMIEEEQIGESVDIIHWMDRSELLRLYQQAHLFLFPSHEGAGMVVAEAMAAGLPVLCFDNCGPGEFVDAHCAYRVPYSQPEESCRQFASHMLDLYYDDHRRAQMKRAALNRFRQQFDWDVKGEQLSAVYEELLATKSLSTL
ncbi:MAG: glycosyltransferase family 4 protein [Bacteroidota bacterium]